MSTLAFYAQFVKSLVGVNSLTVTWDVEQITRADGTRSALVTGGATSITVGRRGLYGYLLAAADTKLYDYVATAITAGDVDQKEIAALWTMYEADALKLSGDGLAADNAEAFFDGTGYAGTNNTIPTVTTLTNMPAAAPTTEQMIAAMDADPPAVNVTTLKGLTEPVDNLVLALGTGGLVEKLNSMLEAAGLAYRFTAAALAEAPTEAGIGAITFTYTLTSSVNASPIADADVWVTTDSAGSNVIAVGRTNAAGQVVFYLDAGTVYVWRQKTGWTFANPDTEVVA